MYFGWIVTGKFKFKGIRKCLPRFADFSLALLTIPAQRNIPPLVIQREGENINFVGQGRKLCY